MNRQARRAVERSVAVLDAGVDGTLSREEWTAYRDQLKAKPTLSLKELRRLAALMALPA